MMTPSFLGHPKSNDDAVPARYVHRCAGCNAIVEADDAEPEVIEPLHRMCRACREAMEDSMQRNPPAQPIVEDNSLAELVPPPRRRPRHALFQRASSYMRFSLDFVPLDRLLQPLEPGRLTMLRGQGASAVAELLAFRAQLPRERGGLDSTAFFIDGGNCSDPYLLASLARRYSFDSWKALRRVISCRVFTMYQLAGLLSEPEGLTEMAEGYGSKLVIVADILGTFNEPEVSQIEAERLLDAVHAGLTAVKKLVVVVTLGSSNRYDEAVSNWSDTLVSLSPQHQGDKIVRAQLLRHPTKKKGDFSDFTMNQLLFHPDSPLVEELVR